MDTPISSQEKELKAAYMKGYFAGRAYRGKSGVAVERPPFRTPVWLDASLVLLIVLLGGMNIGVALTMRIFQ